MKTMSVHLQGHCNINSTRDKFDMVSSLTASRLDILMIDKIIINSSFAITYFFTSFC